MNLHFLSVAFGSLMPNQKFVKRTSLTSAYAIQSANIAKGKNVCAKRNFQCPYRLAEDHFREWEHFCLRNAAYKTNQINGI